MSKYSSSKIWITLVPRCLFYTFLLFMPAPTMAQYRNGTTVPPEVISDLRKRSRLIEECLGERRPEEILAGRWLKLGASRSRVLVVMGAGCVCGASNCPAWIYRKTARGYKLILDADYMTRDIKLLATSTRGYRDLAAHRHLSAFDTRIDTYEFDGMVYRTKECFERRYRDSRGGLEGKLKPRTVRVKCDWNQ